MVPATEQAQLDIPGSPIALPDDWKPQTWDPQYFTSEDWKPPTWSPQEFKNYQFEPTSTQEPMKPSSSAIQDPQAVRYDSNNTATNPQVSPQLQEQAQKEQSPQPLFSKPPRFEDWKKNFRSQEIPAEHWEIHRETLKTLYLKEKLTLAKVRRIMAEKHGFYATRRQCIYIFKRWGLEKNLSKAKLIAILRIQYKRRLLENKETAFEHHSNPISQQLLDRAVRKYKGHEARPWEDLISPITTPPFVTYGTPIPDSSS